jgi:heme/copper-type cytochrome/quinol oxidase subunit 1
MHMSGLLGQPRRTSVLPGELGTTVELYNLLSSLGVIVLIALRERLPLQPAAQHPPR